MKLKSTNCTLLAVMLVALTLPVIANEDGNEADKREVLTLGMNHVGLTVKDLAKSVAFFTETLDWNEVGGYPDYPSKFVTDGEIFLTLWQATDPDNAIAFDQPAICHGDHRLINFLATIRASAGFCASLQTLGRSARSRATSSALLAR